jgi:hypothetical protein
MTDSRAVVGREQTYRCPRCFAGVRGCNWTRHLHSHAPPERLQRMASPVGDSVREYVNRKIRVYF